MQVEIKDFVGVFKNAYPKEFCDRCIDTFNRAEENGFIYSRQKQEKVAKYIKDTDTMAIGADKEYNFMHSALIHEFNQIFWSNVYPHYIGKYDVLTDVGQLAYYDLKMQRTGVGGGYHIWHQEIYKNTSRRVLLFILYLNDVDEGGETELLYYPRRIKPEAGTMLLIPAGFTHTHRGNPPLSNEKYIINGWLEM